MAKLHLALNQANGDFLAAVVTTNDVTDSAVLADLLDQIEAPIEQVSGDGGYDRKNCYQTIKQHKARATIPPRAGAKIWQRGNTKAERQDRDENLRGCRQLGRKQWKQESGYHRRSLSETAMFRIKTCFDDKVKNRVFANQSTELFIRCYVLNRWQALGRADSYKVAA